MKPSKLTAWYQTHYWHHATPQPGVPEGRRWSVDCVLNVMAHAQKPDFVFRRNGRVNLNRRGREFSRLLAAEVCAPAVVMLDTPCSEVVWRVLATHSIRQFPLHFPSLRLRVPSHFNWTLPAHDGVTWFFFSNVQQSTCLSTTAKFCLSVRELQLNITGSFCRNHSVRIVLFIHSLVFSLRGRAGSNQNPVMWPVWLWHTASWATSWG